MTNRERTPLTLLALGLVISGIVAWLIDFVGSGLESIIQGNMHDRIDQMSPSVFREKGYRFYFLSNEEERMHIHVTSEDGEAKFWIEPIISLAVHYGLSPRQLREIQTIVEERKNEIIKAWKKHFHKR